MKTRIVFTMISLIFVTPIVWVVTALSKKSKLSDGKFTGSLADYIRSILIRPPPSDIRPVGRMKITSAPLNVTIR